MLSNIYIGLPVPNVVGRALSDYDVRLLVRLLPIAHM